MFFWGEASFSLLFANDWLLTCICSDASILKLVVTRKEKGPRFFKLTCTHLQHNRVIFFRGVVLSLCCFVLMQSQDYIVS
jgi:hypothetical protein